MGRAGRLAGLVFGVMALFAVHGSIFGEPVRNGFDLAGSLIPVDDILHGGPPKDGIPSIDRPVFVGARDAKDLSGKDMILGVVRNGLAKAYPVRILNWHEVVNDRFGPDPVVITFCPLCGSGVAFEARSGGRSLAFGVSGLLYNSDVLLYDRETGSLWSQIRAQAVTGALKGAWLQPVAVTHTTWTDWSARHPHTLVLSEETGYARDYARDPYAGYSKSPDLMFPVRFRAEGLHPKERVLGIVLGGKAKAYPFVELARTAGVIADNLGGRPVRIRFSREHQSAEALDGQGRQIAAITLFWFAWAGFHPDTELYRAPRAPGDK